MNRKSFQLSLGSLFLATLTFAIGLYVGLEFSRSREQDRKEIEALKVKVGQTETLGRLLAEELRRRQYQNKQVSQ